MRAEIADGKIWGRGAIDMKGLGVVQLMAFLTLKRQNVPLARDVILMAVPDEETGGDARRKLDAEQHYADIDPEYILDEGGFGSRDLFAPGKLVFGISVAEKKILWLKLTAEGIAGHGSQPHDQNPNDRLVRALARLLSEPLPASSFTVLDTMKSRVGTFAVNKFNNAIQHSTISLTSLRSGVGDPPKVNVIPSIAEATIDCRVLPGTSKDQWLAEIRRRLGDPGDQDGDRLRRGRIRWSRHRTRRSIARWKSAVKRRHPDAIVTPMIVPYGTDSNGFVRLA